MARAHRPRVSHRPVKVGLKLNTARVRRPHRVHTEVHGKRLPLSASARAARFGRKHPHKGYHGHRRHHHISAEALARRIGKPHPHRGYHGPRKKHHISAEALARRIGKKHPHRGHAMSAAARAKISAALRARHRKK